MRRPLHFAFAIGLLAGFPQASEGLEGDPLAASKRWSYDHAAHLLRRAGFGGTPAQIEHLRTLGRRRAVDYLVDYELIEEKDIAVRIEPYAPPNKGIQEEMTRDQRQRIRNRRRQKDRLQLECIVRLWIEKMVSTPRPLEEKLTLFWHGHLTSGHREVRNSLAMYNQNNLLRRRASGNFRDLLLDITEDPAMILYLNTQQNRRGKPNENYARELMELFTMGEGTYTEADIKESARAFTGLAVDPRDGKTVHRSRRHDFGEKTFLGRTGEFDPVDIIDIILEQPATAEYMAGRFWTFFAYQDPESEIVRALGTVLRENNYEIKPTLKAMFTSDAFYGERALFTHIKSPVELLIGAMRELEIPARDTAGLNAGLRSMGQQLMQPPNVKGWDGGAAWITTSTLFNRYNVIGALIRGTDNAESRRRRRRMQKRLSETVGGEPMREADDFSPPQPALNPMPMLKDAGIRTPKQCVDYFTKRLLQRRIAPARRKVLIEAFENHLVDPRNLQSPKNAAALRGLIHLITSMPEYQLS